MLAGQRLFVVIAIVACALGATGCGAPPSLTEFSSATSSLRKATEETGKEIDATFDRVIERLEASAENDETLTKTRENDENFEKAWQARVDAMKALEKYAQSLQAIVAANDAGAQAAGDVGAAATELLVSTSVIASPAAGLAADTIRLIATQISNAVTTRDLARTLEGIGPAIEELVGIMERSSESAMRLATLITGKERDQVFDTYLPVADANWMELVALSERTPQLDAAAAKAADQARLAEVSAAAAAALAAADPNDAAAAASAVAASDLAAASAKAARVATAAAGVAAAAGERMAQLGTWRQEYLDAKNAAAANKERTARMTALLRSGMTEWKTAHREVVEAVKESRQLDIGTLVEVAEEAEGLIERWRGL